ncbi:MAG: sortase [Firmicutes bacterium]|nr:sortase [Bacillota bacterium]
MLKRKKEFNRLKIVGFSFILLGLCILTYKLSIYINDNYKESNLKREFFNNYQELTETNQSNLDNTTESTIQNSEENKSSKYIAIIKIPKIKLEKGFFGKDSYLNNVNRNIEILDDSDMPDKAKGNVILAAHSGNSKVSFFRNLHKLEKNDSISIFYQGSEYKYKIVNIYDIPKTGTAKIKRNIDKSTLTLITCRQGTDSQIIIISELVEKG